jgi:Cu/Ag efflux pump CusA
MSNRIISICIRKRLVVLMVAILLTVFGSYSWTRMSVEAYPDISPVTAQVSTQVPGLAKLFSPMAYTVGYTLFGALLSTNHKPCKLLSIYR